MIEIVNLHTCKDFGKRVGDVAVHRGTKWGNPFRISSTMTRDQACDAYDKWIIDQLAEGKLDIEEIAHARRLGCYCHPLKCHAESLRILINLSRKQVSL